jgi:glycine/D-amino acid oxidase-like deaminating enzyme
MPARKPAKAIPWTATADKDPGGKRSAGTTQSVWTATHKAIRTHALDAAEEAGTCIIGGGISGMTTACMLAKAGVDVVVLEDGAIGSGETGRTTAHFTNALDDRYSTIASKHGKKNARLAAQSHTEAIEAVARIVREERIGCHLGRVDGFLFLHPTDKPKTLDDELAACHEAGLSSVEAVDAAAHFESGPALRFPDQLQLHIMEYLDGLKHAIEREGGRIYTDTHARFPKGKVEGNGHKVKADNVIVCSNAPVATRLPLHDRQLAFRTYVIAAEIPEGKVPGAMWWDTGDHKSPSPFPPYHYVRLQAFANGKTMILSGGQDHKVGVLQDVRVEPYAALEKWTRERFPEMGTVKHRWSGEVFEPLDHLAYIGKDPVPRGRYLASGDSGNGMTHGTLAGMILTDLVLGQDNKFAALYDPTRKDPPGGKAKTGKGRAKKLASFLATRMIGSAEDLAPGQGAVIGPKREGCMPARPSVRT